jgi:hypothetical protein
VKDLIPATSSGPGKFFLRLQSAVFLLAAPICLVLRRWSLPKYGDTLSITGLVIILLAILNLAGAVQDFNVRSKKAFTDFNETRMLRYAVALGVLCIAIGQLRKLVSY